MLSYLHDGTVLLPSEREQANRSEKILECKRQIDFWSEKLKILEQEHQSKIKLARLRINADHFWDYIGEEDKAKREFVLAAMESEGRLPQILKVIPYNFKDSQGFALPESILNDKEILLARVARSDFEPKYYTKSKRIFFLPSNLEGDKEVVLAVLPKFPEILSVAARDLSLDKQFMLDAIEVSESIPPDLKRDRQHSDRGWGFPPQTKNPRDCDRGKRYPSRKLQEDPDSDLVLRYASRTLQDDPDVVLAAVKKCGLNLKFASLNLHRNQLIVREAVTQNGDALKFCLSPECVEELISDRDFLLRCILNETQHDSILQKCVDRYPDDEEVLVKALGCGFKWQSVPSDILSGSWTCLMMRVLSKNSKFYRDIPAAMKKDLTVGRIVIESDHVDDQILTEVLKHCPSLIQDRQAMMTMMTKFRELDADEMNLPSSYRRDKEFMLKVVELDPLAYKLCTEELKQDKDILMACASGCTGDLPVHPSLQIKYPDVIIQAINSCDKRNSMMLLEDISKPLWSNPDVALTWLSNFGYWMDEFPEKFKSNPALCLALAKKNAREFVFYFEALKASKTFMLQVVDTNPDILMVLKRDSDLFYDEDLLLRAFSRDKKIISAYSDWDLVPFMTSFTDRVRRRIEDHKLFQRVFVDKVLRSTKNDVSNSPLQLLNQGPDTVQYYTQILASFLGVPDFEEIQMCYQASANLMHWGY